MEQRQNDLMIQFSNPNWITTSICLRSITDGTFLRNLYPSRRRTSLHWASAADNSANSCLICASSCFPVIRARTNKTDAVAIYFWRPSSLSLEIVQSGTCKIRQQKRSAVFLSYWWITKLAMHGTHVCNIPCFKFNSIHMRSSNMVQDDADKICNGLPRPERDRETDRVREGEEQSE